MGIAILVLGESGSGKSTSLRTFKKGEACVLNVAGKPLPFKNDLDTVNNATYEVIGRELREHKFKTYIIDDSQYLLAFEMFDRAKETGYGKFTDIAVRFRNMVSYIAQQTPDNVMVYLLHHVEETDTGKIKAKTVGKMLDNQLTVEGLFSVVLLATTDGTNYKFQTHTDGTTPTKTPLGMFEGEIDNDLKLVDTTVRKYWGLKE